MVSIRRRVHLVLAGTEPTAAARTVRLSLGVLIVVNVVAIVLESVPDLAERWSLWFASLETFSVIVFSVEYAARLWIAPEQPQFARPIVGRLGWIVTPVALIDLAAVLPSLLSATGVDLRVLRVLRLSRLVRIAKLGRYSIAAQTLQQVLRTKAPDLIALLVLLMVLLVVASAGMFHLEHDAQPQTFSSIPATMWWGIVTLTTIGYGDMAPVTALGRVLGGVIAILGIGMFALPAGLLGAAFVEELGKARERLAGLRSAPAKTHSSCPHCGKPLVP